MSLPAPPTLPPGLSLAQWNALQESEQRTWWQLGGDIDWLMKQPQFRRIAMRILDDPRFCGTFRPTFTDDPYRAAYLQGRREAGIDIQVLLQLLAPSMYALMLKEEIKGRDSEGWSRPQPPPGGE